MVKGGRRAQLKYWREYHAIHRDKDRAMHAKKGVVYNRVVILRVKVQLPPLPSDKRSNGASRNLSAREHGKHRPQQ